MVELLLSLVAALVLAGVGIAVLLALTVAPFVVAVTAAERSGRDPSRWGAVATGCALGGLAGALLALRADRPLVVVLLAAATCWLGPALAAQRVSSTR